MSIASNSHQSFIAEDLVRVVTKLDSSQLNNSSLFISGASGFMGLWLTELILFVIKSQHIKLNLYLLAKDFAFAKKEAPHIYDGSHSITVIEEDIRSLHELPTDIEWIIHAAAIPDLRVHNSQPLFSSQTISQGTLSMLECATRLPKLKGFLNVSSGYVHGYHTTKNNITEKTFAGFDPSVFSSAYMEAKRYGESLCTIFKNQYRLPIVNVRPFSFVGPYQSFDAPWAINNFIHDIVNIQPIRIQGDGAAIRSYMYGADMAWWLLNILLRGRHGCSYNLGSPNAITLKELAGKIIKISGTESSINLSGAALNSKPSIFVPSVEREQTEMGLEIRFDIDMAISRTIQWYEKSSISYKV